MLRALLIVVLLALALPATAAAQDTAGCLGIPEAPTARAAAKGPSVKATIRRFADAGAITVEEARRYEGLYARALQVRGRATGVRRTEQNAVVATLEDFARRKILTAGRMPVLFRQLEVNSEWWARYGPPSPSSSSSSGGPCARGLGPAGNRIVVDDVVYQWYPGQGLQIQQLATAGRANGRAKACTEPDAGKSKCRPAALRRALDALVALQVDRGGFRAWEYYFAFGVGRPPWISGMAAATAMQALARGAQHLGEQSYLDAGRKALGAFRVKAPVGVRVPTTRGSHYLLYSFDRNLRVYNGFLQALVGLYDYAEAADDADARTLFERGERELYGWMSSGDTGAWSLYSAGGRESDLSYHRLVRDFLEAMCARVEKDLYCSMAERFTEYLHERTRVRFLSVSPLRRGKVVKVRFSMSKVSSVNLTVRRGGRVVGVFGPLLLGRGAQQFTFTPSQKGSLELELEAKDYISHYTRVSKTVEVR